MSLGQDYMNAIFDEGYCIDIDFYELVSSVNWKPATHVEITFSGNGKTYGKTSQQCFEEALLLAEFMMRNFVFEAYFYEHPRGITEIKDFLSFEKRVRSMYAADPGTFSDNWLLERAGKQRVSIMLGMIKKSEDAPPVTPEIEKIFEFVSPP